MRGAREIDERKRIYSYVERRVIDCDDHAVVAAKSKSAGRQCARPGRSQALVHELIIPVFHSPSVITLRVQLEAPRGRISRLELP
jgi:hypothetical protein